MTTMAFVKVCCPTTPCSTPPTKVSSISTVPESGSRSGRTIARRNLWSQVQAASRDRPHSDDTASAETPFLEVVMRHATSNQSRSDLRVPSKMVPAVSEVWLPQPRQVQRPRADRQPSLPQCGQAKPDGQRSRVR